MDRKTKSMIGKTRKKWRKIGDVRRETCSLNTIEIHS